MIFQHFEFSEKILKKNLINTNLSHTWPTSLLTHFYIETNNKRFFSSRLFYIEVYCNSNNAKIKHVRGCTKDHNQGHFLRFQI